MKKTIIVALISVLFLMTLARAQSGFEQHIISDATHGTQSLFCCDIDQDGDTDILGAAAEDHDVIFWRNDGVSWKKIVVDPMFNGAGTVISVDINGDSLIDILAGAKGGDQIAWWRNSGGDSIIWTKHVIRSNYDFPHEVFACDLDMDGRIDVLAASSLQDEITWWKNEGGDIPDWTEQTIASNFTQAKSVHSGDFNQDGLPDVVGASLLNNEITWWENNGQDTITWLPHNITSTFSGAHRVQAVDLDHDGYPDILGAGWYANQVAWWRNPGNTVDQWEKQVIASGFARTCVAFACDLDNDGDIDVVATSQDGDEVAWWRNDGNNTPGWEKISIDPQFDRVWPVHAADLDNDGDMDVVAASGHDGNNEVRWYENRIIVKVPDEMESLVREIFVFPNPCHDKVHISGYFTKPLPVGIEILNASGTTFLKYNRKVDQTGCNNISIDLSCMPAGFYLIRINSVKNNYVLKKIIKI